VRSEKIEVLGPIISIVQGPRTRHCYERKRSPEEICKYVTNVPQSARDTYEARDTYANIIDEHEHEVQAERSHGALVDVCYGRRSHKSVNEKIYFIQRKRTKI
jgi:hypothetical protein